VYVLLKYFGDESGKFTELLAGRVFAKQWVVDSV
jgi:hypothetical protein